MKVAIDIVRMSFAVWAEGIQMLIRAAQRKDQ